MLRAMRTKGAALTEYAVLIGLIGAVAIGAVARLGGSVGLLSQEVGAMGTLVAAGDNGSESPPVGGDAGTDTGPDDNACEQPSNIYGLEIDAAFNGGADVLRSSIYVVDVNENGAIELAELHTSFGSQFELWRDDSTHPGGSLWTMVNPLYWEAGYDFSGTPDQIQPTTTYYAQPSGPDWAGWKDYGSVAGQMLAPASVSVIPSPLTSGFFIPPCPLP